VVTVLTVLEALEMEGIVKLIRSGRISGLNAMVLLTTALIAFIITLLGLLWLTIKIWLEGPLLFAVTSLPELAYDTVAILFAVSLSLISLIKLLRIIRQKKVALEERREKIIREDTNQAPFPQVAGENDQVSALDLYVHKLGIAKGQPIKKR
jgi:hypothetical protein